MARFLEVGDISRFPLSPWRFVRIGRASLGWARYPKRTWIVISLVRDECQQKICIYAGIRRLFDFSVQWDFAWKDVVGSSGFSLQWDFGRFRVHWGRKGDEEWREVFSVRTWPLPGKWRRRRNDG